MVAFSVCDRLPNLPELAMQPAAPQPAPGIHIVLRGLTLVMYSGANGIELREERVADRVCDQGYMQSRLEIQMRRRRKHRSSHREENDAVKAALLHTCMYSCATCVHLNVQAHAYVRTYHYEG